MFSRRLADVLARLVEARSERELIDDGFGGLAELMGASLVVVYRATDAGIEGHSPGAMASPMASYASHFYRTCPMQALKRLYNPDVAVVSDMLPASARSRSEAISDFYRPMRIERHLTARLSERAYGETGCRGVVFCRPGKDRPWRDADVALLRRVRPLLASAVDRHAHGGEDLLAAALEEVGGGAVLVFDRDARLAWSSRAAGELEGVERDRISDGARRLLAGETVCIPGVKLRALVSAAGDPLVVARVAPRRPELSRAEEAVLAALLEGLPDRGIAARLYISPGTVHSHLKSIYAKLGVTSRSEAIVRYGQS
jgi:DNA-binding CsgD family transcriptional regulator